MSPTRSRPLLALALLSTAILLACPTTSPSGGAVAGGPGVGSQVPGGVVDPSPAEGSSEPDDDGGSTPSSGESCLSDVDCGEGRLCEGQGCGDDEPGACVPRERICTRDSQPYCGCDGQTFRSSGSCPGQRYAHRGECTSPPAQGKPDGAACLSGSECQSGVCEGEGCGDDEPGECKPQARPCTRDYRAYCGCDGQTFHGSGSCPGRRYRARGECSSGATP